MSTRCHLQVVENQSYSRGEGLLLYHHGDGYPSYMVPAITRFAECAREGCRWWEAFGVASMFVNWSIGTSRWPSIIADLGYRFPKGHAPYDPAATKLLSECPEEQKKNRYSIPDFGLTEGFYGDINYWYQLVLSLGNDVPEWSLWMWNTSPDGWFNKPLSAFEPQQVATHQSGSITVGPFDDGDYSLREQLCYHSTDDFLMDCGMRGHVLDNIPRKRLGDIDLRGRLFRPDIAVIRCDECGYPMRSEYRDEERLDAPNSNAPADRLMRFLQCYKCGSARPEPETRLRF